MASLDNALLCPGISIRGTESPPVVLRSGAPAPVLTIDCPRRAPAPAALTEPPERDAVVMGLTLVQDHPSNGLRQLHTMKPPPCH
jgi:hypothetical protein